MAGTPITLRRVVRDYCISIPFWQALAVLVASQQTRIARIEHLSWPFRDMLLLYSIRLFTVALLTPPIFYLVERAPVEAGKITRRVIINLAGYIPFAVIFAIVRWGLYAPWFPETQTWGPRNFHALSTLVYEDFADQFALYLGIIIAAHAYIYFFRFQRQERERLEMQQALMQSELQALRSQIHPHFLFNTLHGITTLIPTNPAHAQKMLLCLSALLRKTLQRSDTELVSLDEELGIADDYLGIEKMRLGDRLTVGWKISPETRRCLVPQLILQSLLDNAVKHGAAGAREGGWIEVTSEKSGSDLLVVVSNSFNGGSAEGTGVGHQNIRSRLSHLYGEDAALSFRKSDHVAVASLRLPVFAGSGSEVSRNH